MTTRRERQGNEAKTNQGGSAVMGLWHEGAVIHTYTRQQALADGVLLAEPLLTGESHQAEVTQ